MYNIIPRHKIWFSFSGLLVMGSVIVLLIWGLNLGIDFTGGSLLEIEFKGQRPTRQKIQEQLNSLDLGTINIQPTNTQGVILRFKEIDEELHHQILNTLKEGFGSQDSHSPQEKAETTPPKEEILRELRFETIGPTIGQELKQKSIYAILGVLVAIILYIAWAFRKVSKPVTSWKYGLIAIIALFHDVLIVVGIFVVLGKVLSIEIDTAFVAALLTILGYSVNDTIVVFDRIRENLPRFEMTFEETINQSVNQTITRSINTSFTTLLVLLAIFLFGGESIKYFVLALILGVIIGTYSSIFIASPLLVIWQRLGKKSA